jgi:pterin-4a-carbinolamine dehydratase
MSDVREPLVFISYRRADSSAASRWLAKTIRDTFGPQSVFIDTEAIRIGDEWPERIDAALMSTTILIPVIGQSWLRMADENGRRRLDKDDDWVRNEIRHALETKLHVIPILLSNTPPLTREALPECIGSLYRFQAFELRDDRWENDLSIFLSRLSELGLKRAGPQAVRYPTPKVTLKELTTEELKAALSALKDWRVIESGIPGKEPRKSTELYRAFEFASFEDAIAFMSAAVPHISKAQHHPRWENLWRTVLVWLTTWDIGHKPSQLDLDLASFLEQLRSSFPESGSKSEG